MLLAAVDWIDRVPASIRRAPLLASQDEMQARKEAEFIRHVMSGTRVIPA